MSKDNWTNDPLEGGWCPGTPSFLMAAVYKSGSCVAGIFREQEARMNGPRNLMLVTTLEASGSDGRHYA